MNLPPFTAAEKIQIAKHIKNISLPTVDKEMQQLRDIGNRAHTLSPRTRVGNNVVDYFTFPARLETKGKYDVNFFEFLQRREEFNKKKFIQTMLTYYTDVKNKNKQKNEYIVLKEVYNICISAINIMRPLNCMEIYTKYKAKRVLNFCAGWGGSTVAAAALNLEAYYGVEINSALQEPYTRLIAYLSAPAQAQTKYEMHFSDAVQVDYTRMQYDTVFCSPPYYFIEKYANNVKYASKQQMDEQFYKPVFANTYKGLQDGGYYIINICTEVYENVLKELLGAALEAFPLKKSKRQNNYTEMVYVWQKNILI
jgi:16S rRNA G966 N2-methylase RsmD